MTSKQRLLACLRGEKIDRVPISCYELCGYDFDAWYNKDDSYAELMQFIREKTDCILMYPPKVNYDNVNVEHSIVEQNGYTIDNILWHTEVGDFGMQTKQSYDVHTLWRTEHFIKDEDDIENFLKLTLPEPKVCMEEFFEKQTELGDNGIMLLDFSDPLSDAADLIGMTDLLIFLYTDKELVLQLMEKLFDHKMKIIEQVCKHDLSDVMIRIYGPEYCTPPYLPNEMFPELCTRFLTPMIAALKKAGAFVRIHSHGNVSGILGEVIKSGADGIDPIESPPDGDITLAEVKQRFGDRLVLFGNIELHELEGSPSERIRELVKAAIHEGKPGGKFILMPTSTPINSPLKPLTLQNFKVMIETALEYGVY